MKNVVVTGATGLLGAHISCKLFLAGYKVTCIHHRTDLSLFHAVCKRFGLKESAFFWKQADILDVDSLIHAFEGMDMVVHCAALVSYKSKDDNILFETNVFGTRNCCNAALKCGIPDFVYASSIAALGKTTKTGYVDENTPWSESKNITEYSRSKYLSELEVWRASEEGLKVFIANPGVIIGAGNGFGSSNQIFRQVKRGLKFYPVGTSGFVDVNDVASAMIKIYENGLSGKRFLLVAENLPYKTVLDLTAKEMKRKMPGIAINGFLLRLGLAAARFCELFRIPFPFPSQGIRSTSSVVYYKSANISLLPDFQYTPIEKSIAAAVAELYSS